jgi:hypothetical protein
MSNVVYESWQQLQQQLLLLLLSQSAVLLQTIESFAVVPLHPKTKAFMLQQ